MLSIQKSPLDKTSLGFEDNIFVLKTHSTNFVSFFESLVSEIVKPVEVTPPRKTRVDLKESKPKNPTIPKDKEQIHLYRFVIFVERMDTLV